VGEEEDEAFEVALMGAIEAAADALDGRERLVERDLEEALLSSLSAAEVPVQSQHSLKLESWSGRVGPLDLSVDSLAGPRAIELKWGGSELAACAWDTVKLTTALAESQVARAYLVAGAPTDTWQALGRGAELFEWRSWEIDGLLRAFARDFAYWRTDVANFPRLLQRKWESRELFRSPTRLTVGGIGFEVRATELRVSEPNLVPIAYAPMVASWKPGARPTEPQPTSALAQEPEEVTQLEHLDGATSSIGPIKSLAGGEGFSVAIASPHYVITDEGAIRDFVDQEDEGLLEKSVSVKRFASPAARRAWLISRKQLIEPWPEFPRREFRHELSDRVVGGS
jgi:hypothetical protein